MSPALTGSSESVSSNPGGTAGAQLPQSLVPCDRQFVTIVSEKQARVVALPSQNCVYKYQLSDADFVVKSEVISMKGTRRRDTITVAGNRSVFGSIPRLLRKLLIPGGAL